MYRSFEDLEVWKRACCLAVRVYALVKDSRDFGLRNQMQRSAVSIACNIAEGSERSPRDFARFLSIARGSAAELRTQTYIATKIGMLDQPQMNEVVSECKEIARMLFGLQRSLKTDRKPDSDTEN